jgi:GT2 family glycosyltransferase
MRTKNLIKKIPVEEIYNLIPNEITAGYSKYVIEELEPSCSEEVYRKRSYRLSNYDGDDMLLTYGYNLQGTFEKSKLFHKALPFLSCQPRFIINGNDFDLVGQEFFDGKPLDLMFAESKISEKQVEHIIDDIKKHLLNIEKPSTTEAICLELNAFIENIFSNDNLTETDIDILKREIIPYLQNFISNTKPLIRWSTGDLIARNILINDNNHYKIIDCEFARETHFFDEDWVRLGSYGKESFISLKLVKLIKENTPFPIHIYHLLRQTLLNRDIHYGKEYNHHLQFDLVEIFKQSSGKNIISSQIFKGFTKDLVAFENSILNYKEKSINSEKTNEELLKFNEKQAKEKSDLISLNKSLENENSDLISLNKSLENENSDLISLNKSLENENSDLISLNKSLENEKSTLGKKNTVLETLQKELKKEKAIITSENSVLIEEKNSIGNEKLSLRHELDLKNDKIKRIEKSFSWKITSLFRLFRRKFLDPFSASPKIDFEPLSYLALNPDLKKLFGNDLESATKHFYSCGIKENRPYSYDIPPPLHQRTYGEWIRRYDSSTIADDDTIKLVSKRLDDQPVFSIIMPVFDPPISFLRMALDSVLEQTYFNWELCIVDDASTQKKVKATLEEYAKKEARIKLVLREVNGHISVASNAAIDIASGKFLVFFDHDDLLRPHSLLRLAEELSENPNVRILYSDEDKIDSKGKRSNPYFKPDWNPELLLSQNYLCHLTCCEKNLVEEVGGFRKGYEGAQDWDLFLRVTERLRDNEIHHIPEILYHWRKIPGSTAKSINSKHYAVKAAERVLQDTILRRKINGNVILSCEEYFCWQIQRKLPAREPLVTILIPSKDKLSLLKNCISSLRQKTDYKNYEIIILDNESKEEETLSYLKEIKTNQSAKVLKISGPFNYSSINNKGAKQARGDILLLLNNDIEIIHRDWLSEIVSQAIRPEIGCVGVKLLYPNDTIQHAGVLLGLGGVAGHAYKNFPKNSPGLNCRLKVSQNFIALTAACLAVRKDVFDEVNGLNEENLAVAFNDVDFCIKVNQAGYRNLWTPHAVLYHHESASRGKDESPKNIKRFQKEVNYMKIRWKNTLMNDPTYNINLTLDREDLSLAFPPRSKK